jgi:hypothetical protein
MWTRRKNPPRRWRRPRWALGLGTAHLLCGLGCTHVDDSPALYITTSNTYSLSCPLLCIVHIEYLCFRGACVYQHKMYIYIQGLTPGNWMECCYHRGCITFMMTCYIVRVTVFAFTELCIKHYFFFQFGHKGTKMG